MSNSAFISSRAGIVRGTQVTESAVIALITSFTVSSLSGAHCRSLYELKAHSNSRRRGIRGVSYKRADYQSYCPFIICFLVLRNKNEWWARQRQRCTTSIGGRDSLESWFDPWDITSSRDTEFVGRARCLLKKGNLLFGQSVVNDSPLRVDSAAYRPILFYFLYSFYYCSCLQICTDCSHRVHA